MDVKIVKRDTGNQISIDGRLFAPLSFKSFRADAKNVGEFYRAGLRLFTVLTTGMTSIVGLKYSLYGESWIGEDEYDFDAIDRQMDVFLENAPEGYFAVMFQLDTREWGLRARPGYPNSFSCLAQMESDPAWQAAAEKYLRAALTHVEEKYGERVFGYFLLCGTTTEWFSERDGEMPYSFRNEAFLREYPEGHIPDAQEIETDKKQTFLDNSYTNINNWRRHAQKARVKNILRFASVVKKITHRKKLVGVYYGYALELGIHRLLSSSHVEYEDVFLSDDIDMISSPSSYAHRKVTDTSAVMLMAKTLEDRGKVYFLEFDHTTSATPETFVPGAESRLGTDRDSSDVILRDFLLCTTGGHSLWWFDMFGGWFDSPLIMQTIADCIRVQDTVSALDFHSTAEVAYVLDPASLYDCNKNAEVHNGFLDGMRAPLALCGASYDYISVCDLDRLGDSYRVLILADFFEITPAVARTLERLRKKGKTLVYLVAPDYLTDGERSAERVSRLVGMPVGTFSPAGNYRFSDGAPVPMAQTDECLCIGKSDARPLAVTDDGHTVAAVREDADGLTVFSAVAPLSAHTLREICKLSGVPVASEDNGVCVYQNSRLFGVYHIEKRDALVSLPVGDYTDLLCGDRYTVSADAGAERGSLLLPFAEGKRAKLLCKTE